MDLQKSLQQALQHLESGAPANCLSLCNEILVAEPGLIEALYLRGCAAYETGDISRSVIDLEIVHDNHPEHLHAAYYFGRSLRAAGRCEDALEPLRAALDNEELVLLARYELATCLTRLRRRSEAIDHCKAILERQPGYAQVSANLASLLERENRLDEADHWTSTALQQDPDNETARITRAILDRRNEKYSDAEETLRELIADINIPVNRSIAWNQLGQCLESQEKWDEAFEAFSESNRILKDHHPGSCPDPRGPHSLQTLARIEAWLREKPLAGWKEPETQDSVEPVFLVGFPRSGTTLLDRMLSAHPEIEVLEEKSLFSKLHQDWSEPGTLEALTEVNEAQISDARDIYRRELSRHRQRPERSVVIDKMPLNLPYLFLIYRLFPNAPVIFLQRNPMDACTSCYFQAFELQDAMANFLDLEQTVEYYDAVMKVASLSLDQVGNPVHTLRYEDLVIETQEQLGKLLDFLGLQVHDAMLEYWRHEADGTSDTPSYQQVSQEPYTRSIGKWHHYSRQLDSSLPVLQPWVNRFGYQETDR